MRTDCILVHILNFWDGQFLDFQAVIWSLEIHENCTNWIRLRQEIIQREYLKEILNIQFWNADIKFPILDFWNSGIQRKWYLRRNPRIADYDLLMLISLISNKVSTKVSYLIMKREFPGSWSTTRGSQEMTGLRTLRVLS